MINDDDASSQSRLSQMLCHCHAVRAVNVGAEHQSDPRTGVLSCGMKLAIMIMLIDVVLLVIAYYSRDLKQSEKLG